MQQIKPSSTAERLTTTLVSLFLAGMGWLTLVQGGIALRGKNGQISFVDGRAGMVVAASFFLFASLVALLSVRSFRGSRRAYGYTLLLILIPPLFWLLLWHPSS